MNSCWFFCTTRQIPPLLYWRRRMDRLGLYDGDNDDASPIGDPLRPTAPLRDPSATTERVAAKCMPRRLFQGRQATCAHSYLKGALP
jgi:hypothetical protein